MNKPTLYLMLGYPGSGKTTTAKVLHDLTSAHHIWADRERLKMFKKPTHSPEESRELYAVLNKAAEYLLAQGKSVIFDTNFNFYKDREKLRRIAALHKAETKLLWLTTDKSLAQHRATQASDGQDTRLFGNMASDVFERMSTRLEEPHESEKPIKLDGTKITPSYIKEQLGFDGTA